MEYAPLVWIGAAASHLLRLDRVQCRAQRIIGGEAALPSLGDRRTMAALSYIYKLYTITTPPQLRRILPPLMQHPTHPRTRRQHRAYSGHEYQLRDTLPARCPDLLKRAFPYCVVEKWNTIPTDVLGGPPRRKHLQGFKSRLWKYLNK